MILFLYNKMDMSNQQSAIEITAQQQDQYAINIITALLNELNVTTTDNGALSRETTLNNVLDFFSKCGSFRQDYSQLIPIFERAFYEDESLALKALFYMRDIRGGQGERESFRKVIQWIARHAPNAIIRNLIHIPTFGRYDDLYSLVDIDATAHYVLTLMKDQFDEDTKNVDDENTHISLLGKWLKSENTSSKESRRLGAITRKAFKLTRKEYQHALTKLRAKINIVETHMCCNQWNTIAYPNVPSAAMKIYAHSFIKHDNERYAQYLKDVASNKTKINASTLYPYEIVRAVLNEHDAEALTALDLQWKALPNYITNESDQQCLVVADVSGSMYSGCTSVRPIDVAISIAIYFAERLHGQFKDHFMTFSTKPKIVRIVGNTIEQKVTSLKKAEWKQTTNLKAVFEALLESAIKYKVQQEDMPTKIFIISDMQFNSACDSNDVTNFQYIDNLYANAGYTRPTLVFWNVNVKNNTPVTKDDMNTFLISGCSPSILKYALNTQCVTPVELMLEVLNNERYKYIE